MDPNTGYTDRQLLPVYLDAVDKNVRAKQERGRGRRREGREEGRKRRRESSLSKINEPVHVFLT